LVAELIQLKAGILVAVATPTAAIVKKATSRIPIVGITLGDPVRLGLIASLARPGGNVTGLAYSVGVQTIVKALEPLREAVPGVRRVAILSNPANPYHVFAVGELKRAAESLGVQLQFLEAKGPAQFESAFNEMAKQRAGALIVVPDSMFQFHRTRLADLAARGRLPAAYGVREYVEAGGLISYGPDLPEIWRRAATYVDKILRGTNPAELPVEQPTKFELVINLKTAKALGLTIPPSLLARAEQVIE
jgi:putative ABC transport system substrate-binding protein